MARTKADKKQIIDKVKAVIADSKTLVFVNFHGIKVADATKIRRKLKGEKVGLFVAKKSLMQKAFEGSGVTGTIPSLDGEVALAYGKDDVTAPAREVYAFQREYKNAISILGGVFDGAFAGKDQMSAIALIPSLPTLHGMFANIINSPIQRFVIGLAEIAKKKTA